MHILVKHPAVQPLYTSLHHEKTVEDGKRKITTNSIHITGRKRGRGYQRRCFGRGAGAGPALHRLRCGHHGCRSFFAWNGDARFSSGGCEARSVADAARWSKANITVVI